MRSQLGKRLGKCKKCEVLLHDLGRARRGLGDFDKEKTRNRKKCEVDKEKTRNCKNAKPIRKSVEKCKKCEVDKGKTREMQKMRS